MANKHFNELTDAGARALESLTDSAFSHDHETTGGPFGIRAGELPPSTDSLDEYAKKHVREVLAALKSGTGENGYV